MEEIEVKFLNINPSDMEAKIASIGGVKVFDRIYRILTMDYPDLRLNQQASWVRIRDEGDKVTMSFKQRQGVEDKPGANDQTMIEHEVSVSDFEVAANIMRSIGLTEKFQEEKHRIRYMLEDVELDIDEMPLIKPYLEIEAGSWEEIDETIQKLGLSQTDKKVFSAFQIYEEAGINMLDYRVLKFNEQVKR